ncbi:hypothetical protein ABW20_dc0107226 [Dactylellina cionopaga]|nr:hypothetical protein ABW20_dc0107226 [Dactylellina cionopaga]
MLAPPWTKSSRAGSRVNLVAAAQAASPEIRTPRLPQTLPTLPPLPFNNSGKDTFVNLAYLWVDGANYKSNGTARLLYSPLLRTLKNLCPEVDWTKLELWISFYKGRRRSRDCYSFLRREDVESFIDYMLKFHPVNKLEEKAPALDDEEFLQELNPYFRKWDFILVKETIKRDTVRRSQRQQAFISDSDMASPGQGTTDTSTIKLPSPTASQSVLVGSRATSADLVKKEKLELPEKRRILISKLVDEGIERVTRAMVAIYKKANDGNAVQIQESSENESSEQEEPVISTDIGITAIVFESKDRSNENLKDIENVVNPSQSIQTVSGTLHKSPVSSSKSRCDASSSRQSPSLSPKEKDAMKAYLAAGERVSSTGLETPPEYQSSDGTIQPKACTQSQLDTSQQIHNSETSLFPPSSSTDALQQHAPLWQPTPVSPHTQSQLHHMHQYSNHQQPQPSRPLTSTSQPSTPLPPFGNLLNYLVSHGTPIGPDTTPHIAMFADQRREKEREERDALLKRYQFGEN